MLMEPCRSVFMQFGRWIVILRGPPGRHRRPDREPGPPGLGRRGGRLVDLEHDRRCAFRAVRAVAGGHARGRARRHRPVRNREEHHQVRFFPRRRRSLSTMPPATDSAASPGRSRGRIARLRPNGAPSARCPPCPGPPLPHALGASGSGGRVTAIADLLDPADRAKLLARLRQLEQLATLMQEVPEQQAACEPPSLTEISETIRKTA